MFHHILLLEVGRYRQEEMLKNGEMERTYRQLMKNRPGLLQQISKRIVAAAGYFIPNAPIDTGTPLFNEK